MRVAGERLGFIPIHRRPKRENPERQLQLYSPGVLVHTALAPHGESRHSLTSTNYIKDGEKEREREREREVDRV